MIYYMKIVSVTVCVKNMQSSDCIPPGAYRGDSIFFGGGGSGGRGGLSIFFDQFCR